MATAVTSTLRQAACNLRCRLGGIPTIQSGSLGVLPNYCQVRGRKHNFKYAEDFQAFLDRSSFQRDEGLTRDSEHFIQKVIADTYSKASPVLKEDAVMEDQVYQKWTRRCGVIAFKIGVVPQWRKDGRKVKVTMLRIIDNHVVSYTPPEEFAKSLDWKPWYKEKFGQVCVGALAKDPRLCSDEHLELFSESGVHPKKIVLKFLVTPNAALQPGTPLSSMHFRCGDYVDICAKTIDHGFQGVVKRWGMKGMPASHGVTKAHRKMGGTGGGGDKSNIWKGKKMPGHMGNKWRSLKGLKIWRINTKYNVLYVSGPNIPGNTHGIVKVFDTILPLRRPSLDNPPPFPTWIKGDDVDDDDDMPDEFYDEQLHRMGDPSVTFE